MGFTVAEELTFPRYGVSAAGCYVTIRATYSHNKAGSYTQLSGVGYSPPMMPGANGPQVPSLPYTLVARYYVYASNDTTLSPLLEDSLMLNSETAPANPIATLYAALKDQHFAGKTITDDL